MADKIALIFDTNFIMEHSKDLNIIVDKLRNTYEIFVTQLNVFLSSFLILYDKIRSNYKQVLPQFYKVVTELINRNYDSNDFPEDIPF